MSALHANEYRSHKALTAARIVFLASCSIEGSVSSGYVTKTCRSTGARAALPIAMSPKNGTRTFETFIVGLFDRLFRTFSSRQSALFRSVG